MAVLSVMPIDPFLTNLVPTCYRVDTTPRENQSVDE